MTESLSPAYLRDALAHFASGVTVVTACSESGPVGVTASAFTSVSLTPPLVLVCLARAANAQRVVIAAEFFAVSVLAEAQAWIAESFARSGVDRFRGVPVYPSNDDALPLVEGALVHLQCRRRATHDGGDHDIVIGEVRSALAAPGRPLLYYRRRFGGFTARDDASISTAVSGRVKGVKA
jgi:flavin reductase (DIM6/NTAB) family NADH-FMN oxidoreductase RutF